MNASTSHARGVCVIKEEQFLGDSKRTIYRMWFDGDQVIDSISVEELAILHETISYVLSEEKGGNLGCK